MNQYVKTRGLQIRVVNKVYKPREDSFLMVDQIDSKRIRGHFCEVGCGTGFVCIHFAQFNHAQVIATDIDYNAARLTNYNATLNNCDHLMVICTDLLAPFRRDAIPATVLFNPPYLPADPEVDPHTPTYELHQLVGGEKGFEEASRLLHTLESSETKVFLIVSSLSTNPVKFSRNHPDWKVRVTGTKNLGFEMIWLLKLEAAR